MSKNNRLNALRAIASDKEKKQLTLQEKWQIDAELARERRKKKNKSKINGPIIGEQVSTEKMKKILQETK